jgi:hypothetical protein
MLSLHLKPAAVPEAEPATEPAPEPDRDISQENEQEREQHTDDWPQEDSPAMQHVIAKSCDGRPLTPISSYLLSACQRSIRPAKQVSSRRTCFPTTATIIRKSS